MSGLHVCQFAPGPYMGQYFVNVARHSTAAGLTSSFVTMGEARAGVVTALQEAGHRLGAVAGPDRARWPLASVQLALEVRRLGAGAVHAHGVEAGIVGLIGARLAGVPVVLGRHHADEMHLLGRRRAIALDRFEARRADRVITASNHTRRVLVEREGVTAAKVVTIAYGLAEEAFLPPSCDDVSKLDAEFALVDELVVLIPARLVPSKGHRFLLRALPAVLRELMAPLRVLVLGEGPERAAIHQEVARLGLGEVVTLVGFRPELRTFYHRADVTVLPTLSEGFGQVVIESMAQATPVIASGVGGVPELLAGGGGSLVPPEDPEALAGALSVLLRDAAYRRQLGAEAQHVARQRFTADRMVAELADAYADLMAAARPGARERTATAAVAPKDGGSCR